MSSNYPPPSLKSKSTLSEARWRTLPQGYSPPTSIPECPPGQDEVEWIAAKTVGFYVDITFLVKHVIKDLKKRFVKPGEGFPPGFTFIWVDDENKDGVLLSAPVYIENCLKWLNELTDNREIFPIKSAVPFPRELISLHISKAFTLMFRIFAVLHSTSIEFMRRTDILSIFNTSLKHFVFFGIRYNLLTQTDEFLAMKSPMRRLQDEYIQELKKSSEKDL